MRVAGAMAAPWAAAMVIFTASRGATAVALLGLVVSTAIIRSPATAGAIVAVGFAIVVSTAMSLAVTGLNVVAPAGHAVHAGHRTMILLLIVALAAGAIRMLLLRLDARIATARAPWTRAQMRGALGVAGAAVLIAFLVLGGPKAVRTAAHKFAAGQVVTSTLARQRLTQFGNNERLEAWRVAFDDGFLRHPIARNRGGDVRDAVDAVRAIVRPDLNAHSLYLEELAELGIVGGGLVIAVVVSILVALARRARGPGRAVWAALFAGALMWAVHAGVDWDWQMPAVTAWFFAAGGLALAGPVAWRERAMAMGSLCPRGGMPASRHHTRDRLAIPDPDREGCRRLPARQLPDRPARRPGLELGAGLALGSVRADQLLRGRGKTVLARAGLHSRRRASRSGELGAAVLRGADQSNRGA